MQSECHEKKITLPVVLRALFDGARTRCPYCHRGRMFQSGFTMRDTCLVCGEPFERASGEVTGGMMINLTLSMMIAFFGGGWLAYATTMHLLLLFVLLAIAMVLIPLALWRVSRGLWTSVLYLTGANAEGD